MPANKKPAHQPNKKPAHQRRDATINLRVDRQLRVELDAVSELQCRSLTDIAVGILWVGVNNHRRACGGDAIVPTCNSARAAMRDAVSPCLEAR